MVWNVVHLFELVGIFTNELKELQLVIIPMPFDCIVRTNT